MIRLKEQKKAVMGKGYKTLFTPQIVRQWDINSHDEHICESSKTKIIGRQCNGVGHDAPPNLTLIQSAYVPVNTIL